MYISTKKKDPQKVELEEFANNAVSWEKIRKLWE